MRCTSFLPRPATTALLVLTGSVAPAYANDGLCDADEQAAGLCFVTPDGFVIEAVTGAGGEFPVIDGNGDSHFEYCISGPGLSGQSCSGVHDISHASILIPHCDGALVILDSWPTAEIQTNGQGDPSCGFGVGDLDNDVLKWDHGVNCNSAATFGFVVAGTVEAVLTDFSLKAGNACDVDTILGPDCPGPFNYCEGGVNSTGESGSIDYDGSLSISDNDFTLIATDLPPNQPTYFFFGTDQIQIPFGDGYRCIHDPERLQKVYADEQGTVSLDFDFTTPPFDVIAPGVAYYFQVFYRDPRRRGCRLQFDRRLVRHVHSLAVNAQLNTDE